MTTSITLVSHTSSSPRSVHQENQSKNITRSCRFEWRLMIFNVLLACAGEVRARKRCSTASSHFPSLWAPAVRASTLPFSDTTSPDQLCDLGLHKQLPPNISTSSFLSSSSLLLSAPPFFATLPSSSSLHQPFTHQELLLFGSRQLSTSHSYVNIGVGLCSPWLRMGATVELLPTTTR